MKANNYSKSVWLGFVSTALGSINGVTFKKLFEEMPFQEIAVVEGLFLCFYFGIQKAYKLNGYCPKQLLYLFLGSCLSGLGNLLFFLSLAYFSPLEFSFLGRNQATISVILSRLLLNEQHSSTIWLAICLALGGSYFFSFVSLGNQLNSGILFVLLYCFVWALRGLLIKKSPPLPIKSLMFWGAFFSLWMVAFDILWIHNIEISWTRVFTSKNFLIIVFTTFFAQGIGAYLYYKALYQGGLSLISSIRSTSPFFVACLSTFFFDYRWTGPRIIGLFCCAASIILFIKEMNSPKLHQMQNQ
ncbi:hypothetical protein PARA125_000442 [Parachlamydia sp. AcF125]|nr:hypothetical protein [Parachlamydia sp. AcF125]